MPLVKNIWREDLTEEELNEAKKKLKEWISKSKGEQNKDIDKNDMI